MKKKFSFTAMAVVAAWLALMPVAQAQTATIQVMKATGTGNARALDLDVLGIVRLTLGAADGEFMIDGTANNNAGTATTRGSAIAICNLITGGSDPLKCSGGNLASTSAPGGPATAQSCTVPPINALGINVEVACASSASSVTGARPTGKHEASVAGVSIGLPADLKALLTGVGGTANGAVDTVQTTLASTLTAVLTTAGGVAPPVAAAPNPSGVVDPVVDQVQKKLTEILESVSTLATIKVLPAQVDVNSTEDKKATVSATSSIVSISLLADLIQVKVTPSKAEATFDGGAGYNGTSGRAKCEAEAAVVSVKVKNLLGDGNLVNLAPGKNLAGLLPLGNDLVGIKAASATPKQIGDSCKAEARGLELSLLKVLNGGIQLRVASTNANIGGAVSTLAVAGEVDKVLPTTGGPTDMLLFAGFTMTAVAFGAYVLSRKLRHSA